MDVRRLSPALGATVTEIDLGGRLDPETVRDLHAAFLDHLVLVFPDQHLDAASQEQFAHLWGKPQVVPYLAAHQVHGHPSVLRVTNMGKERTPTENWHYDAAFFEEPPPIAILAAQELPEMGGDTMWANQYAAHDALSPGMQRLLRPLRAAFTGEIVDDDGERRPVTTYHPVVRIHPETGRPALGIGRIGSVPHLEDLTAEESRPLLEFLYDHVSRPEFVYRHRWRPGDVVMWDNRCLMHYAVHDYRDAERLMHRVTVLV